MFSDNLGIDDKDQVPLKHLKGKHILSMLPQEPVEGEHGKDDHSLQLLRESRQKAIGRSRHSFILWVLLHLCSGNITKFFKW